MVTLAQRPKRGDVFLVVLDPTLGQEIQKTRPCVVVSPDELNQHVSTFLVTPLTAGRFDYPFRIPCRFQKKNGYVVLDQIRAVDRRRLVKRLGHLTPATLTKVLAALQAMFAE